MLVKKHNKTKLELKWEPGYRLIMLPTPMTAAVENQLTGRFKCHILTGLKLKHPAEDWVLKPENIGCAAKYVNHPNNLPDINLFAENDSVPECDSDKIQDETCDNERKGYNL